MKIGVNREYLSGILHTRKPNNSPKVCNAIIEFCIKSNYDYNEFIFL